MADKYTKEILEEAISNSVSMAGVLRYLGLRQAGGTHSHISKQVKKFKIDTSHFTGQGHNKGKPSSRRKNATEILTILPLGSPRIRRKQLLRAMLQSGVDYKCECGLGPEWQGKVLVLDIDHIDGNWLDNRLENLRFLCPNCHSQQETNKPHKNRVTL